MDEYNGLDSTLISGLDLNESMMNAYPMHAPEVIDHSGLMDFPYHKGFDSSFFFIDGAHTSHSLLVGGMDVEEVKGDVEIEVMPITQNRNYTPEFGLSPESSFEQQPKLMRRESGGDSTHHTYEHHVSPNKR